MVEASPGFWPRGFSCELMERQQHSWNRQLRNVSHMLQTVWRLTLNNVFPRLRKTHPARSYLYMKSQAVDPCWSFSSVDKKYMPSVHKALASTPTV